MNLKEIQTELQDPFAAHDIEWRIQQSGIDKNNSPWAMVIPYITNRAIQNRLDDVFGFAGWQNVYEKAPDGGVLCGLRIKVDGEWITKWDGAENTAIEKVKGGLSNSMKRAAVQLGIGRYLYSLSEYFAVCFSDQKAGAHRAKFQKMKWDNATREKVPDGQPIFGSWDAPKLPDFALPDEVLKMRADVYIKQIATAPNIGQLKNRYGGAYGWAKKLGNIDFINKFNHAKDKRKNDLKVEDVKNAVNS